MKGSTLILAGLLTANMVVAGWAFVRSGAHPTAATHSPPAVASDDRPAPPVPSFVAGNGAGIANAERRIAALEGDLARLQANGGSDAQAPSPPRPSPVPDPAQDEAMQEQTRQELADFVAQQNRDAQWAPQYETHLASFVGTHASDTDLKENKCFSSVCRLELEHSSTQSREAFLRDMQRTLATEGQAAAMHFDEIVGSDGKPATVVHVFRAGYPLPSTGG